MAISLEELSEKAEAIEGLEISVREKKQRYFMSIEDAEAQIRKNMWESVFCFWVDMIPVGEDTFLEDHITRCYLPNGELLTQTPPQINRIGGKVRFSGRIPADCRFKDGDVVEVFHGDRRATTIEIVCGLPGLQVKCRKWQIRNVGTFGTIAIQP